MATVRIPTAWRGLAGRQGEVRVTGATVGEVLQHLGRLHPELGARVLDEQGALRLYVNVFLNDEDIRALAELATPVGEICSRYPSGGSVSLPADVTVMAPDETPRTATPRPHASRRCVR